MTKSVQDTTEPSLEGRPLEAEDCVVVDKKQMRRAQIGAGVGNFMEWYDFGIYGYLAVTITAVFTHGMDESIGLLVTLAGFAVSFIMRPLGGMILGPLGDKLGRQKILFLTISMMAISTALIGLLPTSHTIGLWALIPLYLLKMIQGFSTGGEFSGVATYVSEFSPDKKRGWATSFLNSQSMLGFAAGAGTVAITTAVTTSVWGEDAMLDGGWRIPFLIAIPLGAVVIWFRTRTPETPAFEGEQDVILRIPDGSLFKRYGLAGIIRNYWPAVLIGCALTAADSSISYILTSYMPTYLETEVGVSSTGAAVATVPVLVVVAIAIPFMARLSDNIGRRPVYGIGIASSLLLMIPAFAVVHIGTEWSVYLAMFMIAIPATCFLALTASALPALFPTASRYGDMGLTHNVALSAFGGTAPFFSQLIMQLTGSPYSPAFYAMFFSLLALLALFFMKESAGRPLIGSVPVVETREEARKLARVQDSDERIDTSTMPIFAVDQAGRAAEPGQAGPSA
ncbi:MFS transporter [Rothia sp. AR01]|uniref:MFS transporter n=1 Tax=Rothia santali TaxID=2949643 RepID=A0A9X2KH06_9MICC|nr:MFS transporter [Rothia santali]MCP3424703.1 MFS transporter [Rothia santali]